MKLTKTLCIAMIAAGAALAIAIADSASATVLCTTTSTPCANRWGSSTEIDSTLEAGKSSEIKDTNGNLLSECTTSTLKLTTITVGGATSTVEASFGKASLTWNACTVATVSLAGGTVEIHHISSTDNGTVTGKGMQVTVNTLLFGSCTFGLGAAFRDIGTFTGGSIPAGTPPVIDIDTVLTREAGLCPSSARWKAVFEVTSPSGFGMYVEPS